MITVLSPKCCSEQENQDERGRLTLVFIRDVILNFNVNEEGGQQQWLAQLILQVDVVITLNQINTIV